MAEKGTNEYWIDELKEKHLLIDDLNDIWVYTFHKWSKEQADRYYDLIIEEIEFITDNYLIGKSADQTRKNYWIQ